MWHWWCQIQYDDHIYIQNHSNLKKNHGITIAHIQKNKKQKKQKHFYYSFLSIQISIHPEFWKYCGENMVLNGGKHGTPLE